MTIYCHDCRSVQLVFLTDLDKPAGLNVFRRGGDDKPVLPKKLLKVIERQREECVAL